MRRFLWIGVVALAAVAGCSKDEGRTVNADNSQIERNQQAEVQRLQANNNHLPPQARAASVMMMKQQQENARMAARLPRK